MKLKSSLINKERINDVVLFLFDAKVVSIEYIDKHYKLSIIMNTDDEWLSTFYLHIDKECNITYSDLNPTNIRIENKVRKCMDMMKKYLNEDIVY